MLDYFCLFYDFQVDFVIVKRVRFADQIKQYRAELGEEGQYIQMIAKIETLQGLENLEEILEEADAIMFSKHDMATEMPVENVCLAQKYVLGRCILVHNKFIDDTYKHELHIFFFTFRSHSYLTLNIP